MSVPLQFAVGDKCAVGGQRGRILALAGGLATVELGNDVLVTPVANLDLALPRLGPTVRKGKSKQDYGTPPEFIRAVEKRFGQIVCDLAADGSNAKCARFFNAEVDSLKQPWAEAFPTGLLWLNPPFKDIEPWAAKCAVESSRRHGLIAMLTPAGVSTNWFAAHVHRNASVLFLSPRITFDGAEDPYPRDLMLSVFGAGLFGFDCWRWK